MLKVPLSVLRLVPCIAARSRSQGSQCSSVALEFCGISRQFSSVASVAPSEQAKVPCGSAINPAPFAVFGKEGMAMFTMRPAVFSQGVDGNYVAKREGCIDCLFMPRLVEQQGVPLTKYGAKYDKTQRLAIRVKGSQVGCILAAEPATVNVELVGRRFDESEGETRMLIEADSSEQPLKVKYTISSPSRTVTVRSSAGEFKAFQTALATSLPSLYGWQCVMNPSLIPAYIEGTMEEGDEGKKTSLPSADDFFGKK